MIKVGILEASTAQGAELVRILLHHPDVQIVWAHSSVAQGPATSYIHGITGETDLHFGKQTSGHVDVIINCSTQALTPEALATMDVDRANLRLIEMCATNIPDACDYGLCELNRKALVRGAMTARSATPLAMAIELALLPLAKHLMLNSPVAVAATCGVGGHHCISRRRAGNLPEAAEVADALRLAQSSFYQNINIVEMLAGGLSGLMAVVSMRCTMHLSEIYKLYEESYSDHNFVYVCSEPVDTRDVTSTNKCLLHLDKDDDILTVTAVLDPAVKGGAGNAVHIMNLMFGLHERTGLNLITSETL